VISRKIVDNRDPQRGDVVVFRYPPDPRVDYIKRVVGVPGDVVSYQNKVLTINGQPVPTSPLPDYYDDDSRRYTQQKSERLGSTDHRILVREDRPSFITGIESFPQRDACQYSAEGVTCKVPPGHYFMMGDNRDNSVDSRFWGFVPDRNIVGRAFFVWMNFGNLGRVGSFR